MKKDKLILILSVLLLFIIPVVALSATFKGGEEYSLGKDKIIEGDLYVGGASVSIAGDVTGDLLVGGGRVLLTGNVFEDAIIGGGDVDILGNVGDDVRVAAGQVTIGNDIDGDLIVGAGSVVVLPDVVVAGDIFIAGGAVLFEGTAMGDLEINGGEITMNGTAEKGLFVRRVDKIRVGASAVINGDFKYKSGEEAEINESAVIEGEVSFEKIGKLAGDKAKKGIFAFLGLFVIWKFVVLLLAGVVMVLLFERFSKDVIEYSLKSFGGEFVRGFVVLIVVPVVILFLFLSVIGFLIGILGLLMYIFLIIVSNIFAGIIFGSFLKKYLLKKNPDVNWKVAIIGIFLLFVIGLIPIVGWLIKFIFMLLALGTIFHLLRDRIWLTRS